MRFLITSTTQPAGTAPTDPSPVTDELIHKYMKFNEDMHTAGVLVASEGLLAPTPAARVVASGGKRRVVDGPYAETKELVGGYYVIDVKSREEAVEWALRCPVGMAAADVLEIYQMTVAADLPPEILALIEQAAPTWSATFRKGAQP